MRRKHSFSCLMLAALIPVGTARAELPGDVAGLIETHCVSCHSEDKKGNLNLTSLKYEPEQPQNLERWVKVLDRVTAGEMPPKRKLDPADRKTFSESLSKTISQSESARTTAEGRSTTRRLNRREYENVLRDLFQLPWLEIEDALPEDGIAHRFNKSAEALDVSHVQVARYLAAAETALRRAIAMSPERPEQRTVRYYAREQTTFTGKMFFSAFNNAPERATFPVLGAKAQPKVRTKEEPISVGAKDPKNRELEGIGLVCGAYEPTEPKFNQFKAPVSGHYKLRFNAFTVWVGPDGTAGKTKKWSIPDFDTIFPGRRSEPIVVYSETPPRQLRKQGEFDIGPVPKVHELDAYLLAGETIRPDATRLFRSRPGSIRFQNPLAESDGQPGVVYRWMEVEGPIIETWPPASHALLFGDLPMKAGAKAGGLPTIQSKDPQSDAARLLQAFAERCYRRPVPTQELLRFLPLVQASLKSGTPFAEAMFVGYKAVLCSPEFLYLQEKPGKLDDFALATRLSFFLWDSEPDAELRKLAAAGKLHEPAVLKAQTDRLLKDAKSRRFVENFLDYWLDLRRLGANAPDSTLYNDYYLDQLLEDSMLEETRLFFGELLARDLPTRNLISSDFAMVNERLAAHYGLPKVDGVKLRKVSLPKDSVRGGILTQASVLTVTANGTTTSPVLRGAWIIERILGQPSPPPPPVPAVEPDLRGAVTIREQLAKHRDQASCAACHNKIDPPGFALESFDVAGGYRERYRAIGGTAPHEKGIGKNGQPFAFHYGLNVDSSGAMADGRKYKDIREFKTLLLKDERQIARNLLQQFAVYATGAPAGFADRAEVEKILDDNRPKGYGVSSLVHAMVQSEMFLKK